MALRLTTENMKGSAENRQTITQLKVVSRKVCLRFSVMLGVQLVSSSRTPKNSVSAEAVPNTFQSELPAARSISIGASMATARMVMRLPIT